MNLTYTITETNSFSTVKDLLISHFCFSHRLILTLKRQNAIYLNHLPCQIKDLLMVGDLIEIKFDYLEDNSSVVPTQMPLSILYEDDWFLVINKKPGIPIHPSFLHYSDSLSNGVRYYFDNIGLHKKIRPVNRLDKDTSGIVVFAKNEYIQECFIRQMKQGLFEKEYIACVFGHFKQSSGSICLPIMRKEGSVIERQIAPSLDLPTAQEAITTYEVLEEQTIQDIPFSIIKCKLVTGRTHQIRVHMAAILHPLLGDTLYNPEPHCELFQRQALHGYCVRFIHPISKEVVTYQAPFPEDINHILKRNNN